MSGHDIARDADVLLHDAQYRDHEYDAHVGWGHSSIASVMEFAYKANVDQLVLFHHDPYHTDGELEDLLAEAQGKWPGMESRVPSGITAGSTATTPQPTGIPVAVLPSREYPVAVTVS